MMTNKVFVPRKQVAKVPENVKNRFNIQSKREAPKYCQVLISGLGGQGKTTFIGTASRNVTIDGQDTLGYNNLLIIEFDKLGDDTLFGMRSNWDTVSPKSENELNNLLSWLHTPEAEQYDTVAIDAYNMYQDIVYESVLQFGITEARNAKKPRTHDPEILELRDFGRLYRRCKRMNEKLFSLNKHIIVTCIVDYKDNPLDMNKDKDNRSQVQSLSIEGRMAHLLSTQVSLHGSMIKTGGGVNIGTETNFSLSSTENKTRFRINFNQANITFPKLIKEIGINAPEFEKIHWIHDQYGFTPTLVNNNNHK